jgi:HK97 family phage major capsid protein
VTTGTVATLKADDLIAQKYALKVQYWADKSLRWVWHRSVMQLIRQLKDTSGQYLWQPGGFGSNLTVDGMDTLLGVPVILSEYVPSVTTSGTYVSVLGAWSNYWIADAETFTVQRLAELYAEYNQTGFIGRLETDGMPVLEEAFSRLKMQ